jgi:hypothetical protein
MLQVILAILFWFFVPGFLLVNLIFPRKGELDSEYDELYRVALGIVLSVVLVVLMGFALNSLGRQPDSTMGYFTAPYIWFSLIAMSLAFFALGWFRGAYPILGRLHPRLSRLPPQDPASVMVQFPGEKEVILKLKDLAQRREEFRRKLKDYDRRIRTSSEEMRAHYEERRKEILEELKSIDETLRKMEEERAAELY